MTELPDPMTPADCDLRGYTHMPLFGARLFGSTLYAESSDAEFRASLKLWWEAWQQCPAGSLPNSDAALCKMADYGRDTKAWSKVKAMALHGFVLCSDGRLYHPLICEAAITAYAGKLKGKTKREADAERLRLWREARKSKLQTSDETSSGDIGDEAETTTETRDETRFTKRVETPKKRIGEGEERERREKEEERAEAIASDAGASVAVPDARERVWSEGVPILQRLTGKPQAASRSMLGRLLRDCGDDCPRALLLLRQAEETRPIDPAAWLVRAANPNDNRWQMRPSINGATELRRQAERQGGFLAEIPP